MTFNEIRAAFNEYTAVDDNRQRLIFDLTINTKILGHSMAEIGVYRGGTSFLIGHTDPSRTLYVCDSFKGLPAPSSVDAHHLEGDFSDTSYKQVVDKLSGLNVSIIKGFFPDPIVHKKMEDKKYSFVHIDVDLYQSTLECLGFFYSRLVSGAALVVDDYGMSSCPGVKVAVDEFMSDKAEILVGSGHNSCYFIKG